MDLVTDGIGAITACPAAAVTITAATAVTAAVISVAAEVSTAVSVRDSEKALPRVCGNAEWTVINAIGTIIIKRPLRSTT